MVTSSNYEKDTLKKEKYVWSKANPRDQRKLRKHVCDLEML